jgi:hypothetical protein
MKNFELKIDTQVNKELQEIHLTTSVMLDRLHKEVMSLREEAIKKALIALGWTPPWNYNMEEAPRDGTWLLLKSTPMWLGDKGYITIGSWRVDEGMSGDLNPLWLDNSFDPKRLGYASTPVTPIAWKPIVD